MPFFDLTHPFTAAMPVYPGDPLPALKQTATLAQDGFNGFSLSTDMHVGTHMDAPLHMIEDGAFISEIPVSRLMGRGVLIDARGRTSLTEDLLDGRELLPGDVVFVLTGWDQHFREPDYYKDFPIVEPSFAQRVVASGVSILGLDTPSPDHAPYAVHKILLSQNVLLIENLTGLDQLIDVPSFDVVALPAKLQCEAAPVRVVALVQG